LICDISKACDCDSRELLLQKNNEFHNLANNLNWFSPYLRKLQLKSYTKL
jgi:hypothetical protein